MIIAGFGLFTIEPVFRYLGAEDDLIPLIHSYKEVWYFGMVFLVVPMVANTSIRACGDTKTPALIIIVATVSNIVLDPILIFGWMGIPAMGLRGAAIATVIVRGGTMVAALLVLYYRERLLDLSLPEIKDVWTSWKAISAIAIPATITNVIVPFGTAVVTRRIAGFCIRSDPYYGLLLRAGPLRRAELWRRVARSRQICKEPGIRARSSMGIDLGCRSQSLW